MNVIAINLHIYTFQISHGKLRNKIYYCLLWFITFWLIIPKKERKLSKFALNDNFPLHIYIPLVIHASTIACNLSASHLSARYTLQQGMYLQLRIWLIELNILSS